MRAIGLRILGAVAALALVSLAAPLTSTEALAVECTNAGAGGPAGNGNDNGVVSNTTCGQNSVAGTANPANFNNTAIGSEATATGPHATSIGGDSEAATLDSTAVGYNANVTGGSGGTAIGGGGGPALAAHASGENAVAVGGGNGDSGDPNNNGANAAGNFSIAVGQGSDALTGDTIAVGHNSEATDDFAIAIGGDYKGGLGGLPDGIGAVASTKFSVAVGADAKATGNESIALGAGAVASNEDGLAVGVLSTASGDHSTAVGVLASASHANSAAFGNGATTTAANQQMFGTQANTYAMPGIISGASTAAQTGPLSLVTTDGAGHLAADPGLYNQIGMNAQGVANNTQGVAMAMALSNFWVPYGKTMAAGVGVGTFGGSAAFAANIGGQVGDGLHLTGGIAISDHGLVGGRAGAVASW